MGSHSVAGMLKLERSIVSMLARRFVVGRLWS